MLQLMDTAIAFAVVMLLLSLLITAVVQAVSALLDLRGKILQKHIEMLLRQVSPGFRDTFTKLQQKGEAEEKNPDSGTPAKPNGKTLASVIAAAVVYHPALAQGARKVTTFTTRAKAVTASELVAVLKDLASTEADPPLDATLQKVLKEKLLTVEDGIKKWFDTIMSRSSDLFVKQTRVITIIAAVVVAFVFHIDAGRIIHELYTNAEIRNSFVKMADDATARADKVLENEKRGWKAVERLRLEEEAKANSKEGKESDTDRNVHERSAKLLAGAPESLNNCSQADTWLAAQLSANTDKDKDKDKELQESLKRTCDKVTTEALGDAGKQIQEISNELKHSDLTIMSIDGTYWGSYSRPYHLLGILSAMALLSFGAPFWFNTLRQLSNLKPTLATNIAKQEEDEKKKAQPKS